MQHLCCAICVPFTLGNRCIFCYATHTIYAVCQRDLQVNIQHNSLNIEDYHWEGKHDELAYERTDFVRLTTNESDFKKVLSMLIYVSIFSKLI